MVIARKVSQWQRLLVRQSTENIIPKGSRVDIREMHKHGRELLEKLPKRGSGKSRRAMIQGWVGTLKLNSAELWKRVVFAEEYDKRGLQDLLTLENLTWSHVRKLLTIKDAQKRKEFAEKANRNGWSPSFMSCEIEGALGVKNLGGRTADSRPITPGTLHELKRAVHKLSGRLEAFGRIEDKVPAKIEDIRLCRSRLEGVLEKLAELQDVLPKFMNKLKELIQPPKELRKRTS